MTLLIRCNHGGWISYSPVSHADHRITAAETWEEPWSRHLEESTIRVQSLG